MNITLQSDFVLPAEWSEQSGIMLTWPHENTDWKPYLAEITATYMALAREITKREGLLVVTPEPGKVEQDLRRELSPAQMGRVRMVEADSNDTWARDHGPITLVSGAKANGFFVPFHMLDFCFNGWGEKFAYEKDNAINLKLYYAGAFNAALENHTDFVLEGGAIESDGRGTIFTTTSCMTAPHRNQPLTKRDLDARLKILFHAPRVVWIDHGRLAGDDTDGHIDTIVRVAPNDTLLYMGCDDEKDEQYDDFKALEQQLATLRTAEGRPYRLVRLPMPDAIADESGRLPASYANFLVINGAVIVPTYNQPEKDQEAMRAIGSAFLGRDIVGIDARTAIRQHGSLHCLTMQLPKGVLATSEGFFQ